MATFDIQGHGGGGKSGSNLLASDDTSVKRLDLISSVRQLVNSVSAELKMSASTASDIEEAMARLETTDENFSSYELVRTLHSKVEDAVGSLIRVRVEEKTQGGGGGWEEQERITQTAREIIHSKQYSAMQQGFISELRSAVDEMLAEEKVMSRPFSEQEKKYAVSSSHSSATQYLNLDGSASSGMSSFNQTGLMFMSRDQLQSIAESLSKFQSCEVRLEAMHHLLKFPPGDLVSCDNWSSLREAVSVALMDHNTELADLSLKFHYRMFTSRSSQTSSIVYLSLVDRLMHYFLSQKGGSAATIAMGIDPSDETSVMLLARFRFLNYIQMELPTYWLRYNEGAVVDILEATSVLLAISYSNPTLLGPAHYMALFDPKAAWFRKWTHGQSSMVLVVDALRRHPIILQGMLLQILKFKPVSSRNAKNLTCSAFEESKDSPFSSSSSSFHSSSSSFPTSEEVGYYNEKALQYAHFVQCVSMLERLLLYKQARELFPVKIPGRTAVLTVTDLLLHLLQMLLTLSSLRPPQVTPFLIRTTPIQQQVLTKQPDFNPITILAHVFEEMITGSSLSQEVFCNEALLSAMVAPVEGYLESDDSDSSMVKVNEEVLILLGDLLAVLASTDATRKLILHQETEDEQSSSVVDVIVRFTILALSSVSSPVQVVSPPVASAWLFVCRQLYKTGDGLLVLEESGLHQHVARAWKNLQSSEKLQGGSTNSSQKFLRGEMAYSLEDSLIDNLLNFAGTPKGILLLQQTGLMAQCTKYMHQRYELKLQVSKCEKFGYGCMVTQLASTVAGVSELMDCGFISMLVKKFWCVLEGQEHAHDYRITAPRTHPLDPLDRTSHKAVINLLNVLSSFPALYEAIRKTTPSSHGSEHSAVSDILNDLVIMDTEEKRHRLLNFEEEHLFGLTILSVLVTCLDSILFLESEYQFINSLFSLQKGDQIWKPKEYKEGETAGKKEQENMMKKQQGDIVILDACSMERNRILATCYFIGGPNERILPPHYLSEVCEEYQWPLFTGYPAPSVFQVPLWEFKHLAEPDKGVLWRFLSDSTNTLHGDNWTKKLRLLFKAELKKKKTMTCTLVKHLLLRHTNVTVRNKKEVVFPYKPAGHTTSTPSLPSSYTDGIAMVVRYGEFLGLLDSSSSNTANLSNLLQNISTMWEQEQYPRRKTNIEFLDGSFPGFDWLSSSIFLLMRGSVSDCWQFLEPFSTLLPAAYMWVPRMHLSVHLPVSIVYSGIPPISAVTAHLVEVILQSEVPHVSSAFKMSGYTPSQICQHWIRQCFWNFLDWVEICNYFSTCVVLGIDYQVYFCVSVLKHLKPEILRHTQAQDLLVFLKEDGLVAFHTADWLDFMDDLAEKFGNMVQKALTDFFH